MIHGLMQTAPGSGCLPNHPLDPQWHQQPAGPYYPRKYEPAFARGYGGQLLTCRLTPSSQVYYALPVFTRQSTRRKLLALPIPLNLSTGSLSEGGSFGRETYALPYINMNSPSPVRPAWPSKLLAESAGRAKRASRGIRAHMTIKARVLHK